VQFGRSGFVGRFTSPVPHERGTRVIVRGPRGVEPGVVLCEPAALVAHTLATEGDLLRTATPDDELRAARLPERETELMAAAVAAAEERGLPLTFVDAELTLDEHLILHGLAWAECDATQLFEDLSHQFNLSVRLFDLSRTPVAHDPKISPDGCGKPNCGSEAGGCTSCGTTGGCSSGSCSRSAVKSAEELTAYFADLRQKMDAGTNRTPLN
jgi:cell fate regulator YaaT (PSP1 superfamily)